MSKVIYYKDRESEDINDYNDLYCWSYADDLFLLQQDMFEKGYYPNIFDVIDFWDDYSDSLCASFIGYTKGSFSDYHIESARYPVYKLEDVSFLIEDISDEVVEKVKKDAKEIFDIYSKGRKDCLIDILLEGEYEAKIKAIFEQGAEYYNV